MENATGWEELYDGQLVQSVFTMYDEAFSGWTIAILFFIFQFMLYVKTQNSTLCWIVGLFSISLFIVVYGVGTYFRVESMYLIFLLLTMELGGILYVLIWK